MAARNENSTGHRQGDSEHGEGTLRVIGGRMRGRKFLYTGDRRTRPMKQRVREAVFNLVGPDVVGTHVIDLFAGSGALAWEALSRGAKTATLVERHFPTARVIGRNAELLGVASQIEQISGDTFIWARKLQSASDCSTDRWLVFCSPPYDFYVDRTDEMLDLIQALLRLAPPESLFVVECDGRFDVTTLPHAEYWDVRPYPPAVVALHAGSPDNLGTD